MRDLHGVNASVLGIFATAAVGVAVVLAFGSHSGLDPVHPVAAVSKPTPVAETSTAPTTSGCWMFCNEPSLPPVQDSRGCRLFCELGTAQGRSEWP
ncbi:hypothetical protein [Nocardia terpenica]|uniref:hypothetical protein n=1 Tax=Nocardia terpenica TaxID=455432 RepID=UPI0012E77131|nr:hypothetical protein [Nocardia terpenica]NQE90353.1 hypothetical protein [Nocardia terpenica]